MAFKSIAQVKAEKYAGKFVLENDGDNAFVIFLYRNNQEMLAADAHYIKSAEYSGYVHCLENGCPACAKGLRVQTKLFVPMYVLAVNGNHVNEIQFWDRNMKFEPALSQAIFKNYANPSEYIFKITRMGEHGSKDTKYSIAVANTNPTPFDKIMADNGAAYPAFYEGICKEVDKATMEKWLASANVANATANQAVPEYTPTPRVAVPTPAATQLDVLAEVEAPFDVDGEDEAADDVDFN